MIILKKKLIVSVVMVLVVWSGLSFFGQQTQAATNIEFTIGTYYFLPNFLTLESRYEELRKGGFDLIIADQLVPGYFTPGPGAVAEIESICDNVLSAGDKYGIQVMFQPSGFFLDEDNTGFWNLYSAWRLPDYREAIKKAFQNCAPRHNSFWGFFTQDEANYEWRFDTYLETMKSGYEEIMAALPSAHVFQNFGPHGDVDYLRSWIAADTIGSDPYPISTYEDPCGTPDRLVLQNGKYVTNYFYNGLSAGTPCDVNVVGAFTKNMVDAAQGKSVWMTLQAFDMKRYIPSLSGKNTPDYTDLHAMAYSAITHGASGIMWYGLIPQFPDLTTSSQIYQDVVKVNKELQSIKAILSSPTTSNFIINSVNIDQLVKIYNNDKYVILLNRQDTLTSYLMSVNATQAQNVLTGPNLQITNGQLSDTIEPHGVRVYKIQTITVTPSPSPVPLLSPLPLPTPSPTLTSTPRATTPKISPTPSPTPTSLSRIKLMRFLSSPKVYYITEKGYKRWIPTADIFLSYGNRWEDVMVVSQYQLDSIPDDILIKLSASPKVYKLENNKKRWITSPAAFNRGGFQWDQIAPVNQTEFDYYQVGTNIK